MKIYIFNAKNQIVPTIIKKKKILIIIKEINKITNYYINRKLLTSALYRNNSKNGNILHHN